MKISFEIDGRPTDPQNLTDAVERTLFAAIERQIRSKLQGVRDPETGEFPVIAVRGRNIDNLRFEVTGSPKVVSLVKERLGLEVNEIKQQEQGMVGDELTSDKEQAHPCAFVCHASEDKPLARQIASDFQSNGIETFFDEWEIRPGDSLRQKIDAGLGSCTHFIALLTPHSIAKPWVNVEIDAGFVRKVDGQCRFIPLRNNLPIEKLSPLLRSLNSPELTGYERDIRGLIDFIHGISQKPPLGNAPRAVTESIGGKTGLSPAAELIAKLMIEKSEHGLSMDPMIEPDELRKATELQDDDIIDAIDELESWGFLRKHVALGSDPIGFVSVAPEAALFVALDKYYEDWDPETDAMRIAADLVNGSGEGIVGTLAQQYDWLPRRMNPAVSYLIERDLVNSDRAMGAQPWCCHWITKSHATRRFVRDRS